MTERDATAVAMTARLWNALGGGSELTGRLAFSGEGSLASAFPVTDLAVASVGTAGLAASELIEALGGGPEQVTADRRLASFWFAGSLAPVGWQTPPTWDAVAGDYPTADGWIRLHTNAPHHRAAALRVLRVAAARETVAEAVKTWAAEDLEQAIDGEGGCAATMRSADGWRSHPQGKALSTEPLAHLQTWLVPAKAAWGARPGRPLAGLKVLDCTRVLAGPVATRLLAGLGAEVLRIDPPDWDEPAVIPEVTVGKRCARLDLRDAADRERFKQLLAEADVMVHGYRPGALEGLGFGEAWRRAHNPGLVEVTLDAYGWTGPWAGRRGFDSLLQMACGMAHAGMAWKGAAVPTPLPVQALDHGTGYLMAAAVMRGLTRRLGGEGSSGTRLSLARTARALMEAPPSEDARPLADRAEGDLSQAIEHTAWGDARRLRPPVALSATTVWWDRPAGPLGKDKAGFG